VAGCCFDYGGFGYCGFGYGGFGYGAPDTRSLDRQSFLNSVFTSYLSL
jgi:hypothetical protein